MRRDPVGPGRPIHDFRPVPQDLPEVGKEEPELVRTALSVEARDGKIHVFFPPLFALEDWLELTAAVEDIATELGRKVVLEGYLPPEDPRLLKLLRHSRSGRDRGEHSPPPATGPTRSSARGSFTRRPGRRVWPPKSSCWTASTPARAAATMS